MTVTTYAGWVADGRPAHPAACIASFIDTMRGHGYNIGYYPDDRHLHADPPEDHTPYSHTPWPGAQPYPAILATDLYDEIPLGLPQLHEIAERIVVDKNAGAPGTGWIKYMNYTDVTGRCWHVSWEPGFSRTVSTDTGHIHISARTDYVNQPTAYDPIGEIMALSAGETSAIANASAKATLHNADINGGPSLSARLDAIEHTLTMITAAVAAIGPSASEMALTPAELADVLDGASAKLRSLV